MSKKNGFGKLLAGIGIGVGLGILFAPQSGEKTRKELKEKACKLIEHLKEVDYNEVKDNLIEKIHKLQDDLADLDKEKVLDVAKEKAALVKKKTQELVELAIEKGTPVLRDAAEEVRLKSVEVTKDVLKKLEGANKKNDK